MLFSFAHDVFAAVVARERVFSLEICHRNVTSLMTMTGMEYIIPAEVLKLKEKVQYIKRMSKVNKSISDIAGSPQVHWQIEVIILTIMIFID